MCWKVITCETCKKAKKKSICCGSLTWEKTHSKDSWWLQLWCEWITALRSLFVACHWRWFTKSAFKHATWFPHNLTLQSMKTMQLRVDCFLRVLMVTWFFSADGFGPFLPTAGGTGLVLHKWLYSVDENIVLPHCLNANRWNLHRWYWYQKVLNIRIILVVRP